MRIGTGVIGDSVYYGSIMIGTQLRWCSSESARGTLSMCPKVSVKAGYKVRFVSTGEETLCKRGRVHRKAHLENSYMLYPCENAIYHLLRCALGCTLRIFFCLWLIH